MSRKGGKGKPHPRQLANPTNWVKNLSSKHNKYMYFYVIKMQSDGQNQNGTVQKYNQMVIICDRMVPSQIELSACVLRFLQSDGRGCIRMVQ